jgi:hypothetical protein
MKSDAGSIERQGAAQGLSEVLAGMDVAYVMEALSVLRKLQIVLAELSLPSHILFLLLACCCSLAMIMHLTKDRADVSRRCCLRSLP